MFPSWKNWQITYPTMEIRIISSIACWNNVFHWICTQASSTHGLPHLISNKFWNGPILWNYRVETGTNATFKIIPNYREKKLNWNKKKLWLRKIPIVFFFCHYNFLHIYTLVFLGSQKVVKKLELGSSPCLQSGLP